MTKRADLSSTALRAISPDLTLITLSRLSGISDAHLSRMASGKRGISKEMSDRLDRALEIARQAAAKGTLPKRSPWGMRRRT